jgi:hypothetical protein
MQGMQEILLTLRTAKMIVERTPQVYRRVMEDIYFSSLALEVASPVHTIQYVRSSDICCLITQYKYYDEVTGDVQITTHMGTPAPHNRPWRLLLIVLEFVDPLVANKQACSPDDRFNEGLSAAPGSERIQLLCPSKHSHAY